MKALIDKSEKELMSLFCEIKEYEYYKQYIDRYLLGMYDHNFYLINHKYIDDNFMNLIKENKTNLNQGHIKISTDSKSNYLLSKGFEEEVTLTMGKEDYHISTNINKDIRISNLVEEIDKSEALIKFEINNYGSRYGVDFCDMKMRRYISKVNTSSGLNFFFAYMGDILVASLYSFYNGEVVAVDGLHVLEGYRHKYIASTLIKAVADFYKVPIYLHADEDDTPKDMYQKLGFKIINKSYDYLKVDEEGK